MQICITLLRQFCRCARGAERIWDFIVLPRNGFMAEVKKIPYYTMKRSIFRGKVWKENDGLEGAVPINTPQKISYNRCAPGQVVLKPTERSKEQRMAQQTGVSVFLCSGWLGPAVRQALVLPARSGKSVSVQDRKLIHCHFPVVCRMTPVGGDVAQPKPYQFRRSLIGREVPSSLDDLA
ncbi:hypothetical protein GSU75_05440 [Pseudomonas savastanoi pv. phaseolicola]|nr:hypothetical protein [Pseudomonas savastanoi pv. phaseolicola]